MGRFIVILVNVIEKIPFFKKWFLKEKKDHDQNDDIDPNNYTLY